MKNQLIQLYPLTCQIPFERHRKVTDSKRPDFWITTMNRGNDNKILLSALGDDWFGYGISSA